MVRLILALAFLPATLTAQTVTRTLDLAGLGWGHVEAEPIEADGDPLTLEWLVTRLDMEQVTGYRVVQERPGGYCVGPWFLPDGTVKLVTRQGRAQLVVTKRWGFWTDQMRITLMKLDVPSC